MIRRTATTIDDANLTVEAASRVAEDDLRARTARVDFTMPAMGPSLRARCSRPRSEVRY